MDNPSPHRLGEGHNETPDSKSFPYPQWWEQPIDDDIASTSSLAYTIQDPSPSPYDPFTLQTNLSQLGLISLPSPPAEREEKKTLETLALPPVPVLSSPVTRTTTESDGSRSPELSWQDDTQEQLARAGPSSNAYDPPTPSHGQQGSPYSETPSTAVESTDEQQIPPCDRCGKRMKTLANLKRHRKSSCPEVPDKQNIPCKHGCGEWFTRRDNMSKHARITCPKLRLSSG